MINPLDSSHGTICIIQIARIGDLLQTYQSALQFKAEFPSIKLILIARKKFALPLSFLLGQVFDEIFYLDIKSLIPDLDKTTLQSVSENLALFLNKINNQKISVTINLTFSKSSNFLHSLIESKYKLGPFTDIGGKIQVLDIWSQYIYSIVMRGHLNPFSLVDIYRWLMGSKNTNFLVTEIKNNKNNRITIHPFASHEKKHWPAYKWSELIFIILKNLPGIEICLVGSAHDQITAKKIISTPALIDKENQIINHVGKTSLREVAKILSKSDLFIGHDSMVGHLASIEKIKTITLSMGTVRPSETTPYGNQNYNFAPSIKCFPCFPNDSCTNYACQGEISPASVANFTSFLLKDSKQDVTENINKNIHLFSTSKIYYTSNLDNSFQKTSSLTHQDLSLDDTFKIFYTILWSFIIRSKEFATDFPFINESVLNQLYEYKTGIEKLYELSEFGLKYILKLNSEIIKPNKNIEMIGHLSKKLHDIEELENSIKSVFPLLAPIIDFYFVAKSSCSGKDLVEISENSVICFNEMKDSIKILYELVTKTIDSNRKNTKKTQSSRQQEKGQ